MEITGGGGDECRRHHLNGGDGMNSIVSIANGVHVIELVVAVVTGLTGGGGDERRHRHRQWCACNRVSGDGGQW